MSRKKKTAVILAGLVVLYALAGFLIIPFVAEKILPEKLTTVLNRPVHVENIRFNPFSLTAALEGLKISDKNAIDPFVAFDELFVNVQFLSLFKLGLVVKEVRLTKPDIHLIRLSETGFNFSDLIPETAPEQEKAEPEADGRPFQFSISKIAIIDGNIAFQDNTVQKQHVISEINLTLPHISNFDPDIDSYSEPLLTADLNQANISIDVDAKPFHGTLETIVNLSASNIEIPHYFAYVPEKMVGFEIRNGKLNIDARITFLQQENAPELILAGTLRLTGLELFEKNDTRLLTLPEIKIDMAPSRPLENDVKLATVKITSPELYVSRDRDGIINLTTLGPQPDASSPASVPSPQTSPEPEETSPETGFLFEMAEFLMESGKILFADYAPAPGTTEPEMTGRLRCRLTTFHQGLEFSSAPEKTADFYIQALINEEAGISTSGQVGIKPFLLKNDFSLSDLKLTWLQPYIPASLELIISGGTFSASGNAEMSPAENGDIASSVTGNAAVNDFSCLDPLQKQSFAAWQTFSLNGIDVSTHPLKISTDKILLKDFQNRFIIFSDGVSNTEKIFKKNEASKDETSTPGEPETPEKQSESPVIPVQIGEVLLDNFDFQFIDQNIEPHFSTRLNLSELRVTGLTSEDFKAAELNAEGKIDEYAPIKIDGAINPLKQDLFLNVTYSLSNLELSPLSPYTGKYIGRMIEKGKLSTEVTYKIDKKEINAQNRILLDQFTLGQTVDSKDALKLPVGVAIALLKDRNGQINVNLPVSGRTDDPAFGFGKPLLKALQNLIVKAATSPFDLVSSVVGGGEELRYIEFDAASSTITDGSSQKLAAVKKLMFERPALNMDISGYVDANVDRDALADILFSRKLKLRKLNKDASPDMASVDALVLTPEEKQKLLKKIYAEELLSDPEKGSGLKPLKDPTLTIEEMTSLLRREITVSDAEMRLLALQRAREVKNHLLTDGSISPDRLFLKEPNTLSPEKKDEYSAARVELNVR